MNNPQELAERYAALWNEPDPTRRRERIRALWTPNGAQVLVDAPQEARAAADQLRFRKPTFEVHGYDALLYRAGRFVSHVMNVRWLIRKGTDKIGIAKRHRVAL
jgi:hypothetical protein